MALDIIAHLDEKNPKRVAAGVRQRVRQFQKAIPWIIPITLALCSATVAAFFVDAIPGWAWIFACVFLGLWLFWIFQEWVEYSYQRQRLAAIEAFICQQELNHEQK